MDAAAGEQYNSETIYETFFKSGLHGALWPSDTYCVVEFVNSGTVRVFKKTSVHAEICMLESAEFQGMVKGEINVYISYSCCSDCSTAIIRTIEAKKEVKMNIVAAGPFNVDRYNCPPEHNHKRSQWNDGNADGLRNIFQHPQMTLRAFERKDWIKLVELLKKSGDCVRKVTFDQEEYQRVQRRGGRSREEEDAFAAEDFKHIVKKKK